MTDITDKIAAIPEGPDPLDYGPGFADQADFEECRANRAIAERDLALEVLGNGLALLEKLVDTRRAGIAALRTMNDIRAVLAACGKGEG